MNNISVRLSSASLRAALAAGESFTSNPIALVAGLELGAANGPESAGEAERTTVSFDGSCARKFDVR